MTFNLAELSICLLTFTQFLSMTLTLAELYSGWFLKFLLANFNLVELFIV